MYPQQPAVSVRGHPKAPSFGAACVHWPGVGSGRRPRQGARTSVGEISAPTLTLEHATPCVSPYHVSSAPVPDPSRGQRAGTGSSPARQAGMTHLTYLEAAVPAAISRAMTRG
jgi:hypothetical protein